MVNAVHEISVLNTGQTGLYNSQLTIPVKQNLSYEHEYTHPINIALI